VPENDEMAPVEHPALPVDADAAGDVPTTAGRGPMVFLRSRWDVLGVIAAGGALGSLGRWGVGELVPWSGTGFPWATFTENVTGAFALGALMVYVVDVWPPRRYVRPFLGVGLLGGYTTFSTYRLETHDLLAAGRAGTALAYVGGSLLVGLVAVWLGIACARALAFDGLRRRRRRPGPAAPESPPTDDTRSTT
jgi:CrcB protein